MREVTEADLNMRKGFYAKSKALAEKLKKGEMKLVGHKYPDGRPKEPIGGGVK